jgi:4-amino-4-deoxy-L-arabinose transferase-like glycosyltransferase
MRVARTIGLLTFFAGLATWLATRAALQRRDEAERSAQDDRLRWETDGGATTGGPQPPGATF